MMMYNVLQMANQIERQYAPLNAYANSNSVITSSLSQASQQMQGLTANLSDFRNPPTQQTLEMMARMGIQIQQPPVQQFSQTPYGGMQSMVRPSINPMMMLMPMMLMMMHQEDSNLQQGGIFEMMQQMLMPMMLMMMGGRMQHPIMNPMMVGGPSVTMGNNPLAPRLTDFLEEGPSEDVAF